MSQQNDEASDNTFDVLSFIRSLERRAAYRLQMRGCSDPDHCGREVVSDLLPKHCRIIGDKIVLDHPAAIKQQPFLNSSLRFKVWNKKRDCKQCKVKTVRIIEEPEPDTPYSTPSSIGQIDPQTPDSLLSETELIERVLSRIKDKRRRAAFRAHVLDDYSHEEIATELGVSPTRVRKWFERDKALLRKEFPNADSLGRDWPDHRPGLLRSLI
jgi:hypothetical protein